MSIPRVSGVYTRYIPSWIISNYTVIMLSKSSVMNTIFCFKSRLFIIIIAYEAGELILNFIHRFSSVVITGHNKMSDVNLANAARTSVYAHWSLVDIVKRRLPFGFLNNKRHIANDNPWPTTSFVNDV